MNRLSKEDLIQRIENKLGKNKFSYDKLEYLNQSTPIYLFCNTHKDYISVYPYDIIKSNRFNSCPVCKFNLKNRWKDVTLDSISYTGQTGYTDNTEFFDGYNWIKISDFNNSKIAVYNINNNKIYLENPLKYFKYKNLKFINFKTCSSSFDKHKGLDLNFSFNSKLLYKSENIYTAYVWHKKDYPKKYNYKEGLISTFKTNEITLNINENYFRFLIHVYLCKSAYFKIDNYNKNIILYKKHIIEINRLKTLLDLNDISYELKEIQPTSKSKITYLFIIKNINLKDNVIPYNWYYLSTFYRRIILDEIYNYCYTINKYDKTSTYFECNNKDIFNFLQFTFHTLNIIPNYFINNDNYGISKYFISQSNTSRKVFQNFNYEEYINKNYSYNFNTSTGYILLRQNNFIFIGTDGKYEIK